MADPAGGGKEREESQGTAAESAQPAPSAAEPALTGNADVGALLRFRGDGPRHGRPDPRTLARLQRNAGNSAVARMLAGVAPPRILSREEGEPAAAAPAAGGLLVAA